MRVHRSLLGWKSHPQNCTPDATATKTELGHKEGLAVGQARGPSPFPGFQLVQSQVWEETKPDPSFYFFF
jgi:hypothetical protein